MTGTIYGPATPATSRRRWRSAAPFHRVFSATRSSRQERPMSEVSLRVNGQAHTVDVDPSTPLLYILRNDLGLQGPRFGCGLGQCGACTVIINGGAVRSCITPVANVNG